ncbi:MAG TPA: metallophosphoesterase [candidate division Zixibacteria bacterium]|nr:metallophosphoesterase [candidate division Zixibacteria bacterium]HPM36813.1 metallophosphoesterase [candidate division Zixibacteria bacterium]
MRLAVISDVHLGDPMCQVVVREGGRCRPGPRLEQLQAALAPGLTYLVLIGDILDFSLATYEEVYEAAEVFFGALAGTAEYFVYVPGNHDFDVWTTVEYQVNIINRLDRGKPVRPFRWTVPAVFDDRPGRRDRQVLPTVDPSPEGPPYGGLFLDALGTGGGGRSRFIFAYPNAYLATADGELIMMTHGHYFEWYWSALYEAVTGIVAGHPPGAGEAEPADPTLEQMVAVNSTACQLSCSGIGQAGLLSRVINEVVAEVKVESRHRSLAATSRYLDNAIAYVDAYTRIGGDLFDRLDLDERVMEAIKARLMRKLRAYEAARRRVPFLRNKGTRERFGAYFAAGAREIAALNERHACALPESPGAVIFGHTHRPLRWEPTRVPNADYDYPYRGRTVRLFNAGAWINREREGRGQVFSGAEVFLYDSDIPGGMTSVAIEAEAGPGPEMIADGPGASDGPEGS